MMENAGTGGAIFRNFYRDFLFECMEYFPENKNIKTGAELYRAAATNWTEIAQLIKKAGETIEFSYLEKASKLCFETALIEKEAMELLIKI
jgi:hypothetical protein